MAPNKCLNCGREGALACPSCLEKNVHSKPSVCFRCNRLTLDFRTCSSCRPKTSIGQVLIVNEYHGLLKELINRFKYHRAEYVAPLLAEMIYQRLQVVHLDFDLIVPVPTSAKRYRRRGYNQAELLARELSGLTGAECRSLLRRSGNSRQVGADRDKRINQLKGQIFAHKPGMINGRKVLVVDDVLTTGATLSECAKALRRAGAKKVVAAVVAKH